MKALGAEVSKVLIELVHGDRKCTQKSRKVHGKRGRKTKRKGKYLLGETKGSQEPTFSIYKEIRREKEAVN